MMQHSTQKAAGQRLYTMHFCCKFTNNSREYQGKIQKKKKKNAVNYVNNKGEKKG